MIIDTVTNIITSAASAMVAAARALLESLFGAIGSTIMATPLGWLLAHPLITVGAVLLAVGAWQARDSVVEIATRDTAQTLRVASLVLALGGGVAGGRLVGRAIGTPQQITTNLLAAIPL